MLKYEKEMVFFFYFSSLVERYQQRGFRICSLKALRHTRLQRPYKYAQIYTVLVNKCISANARELLFMQSLIYTYINAEVKIVHRESWWFRNCTAHTTEMHVIPIKGLKGDRAMVATGLAINMGPQRKHTLLHCCTNIK